LSLDCKGYGSLILSDMKFFTSLGAVFLAASASVDALNPVGLGKRQSSPLTSLIPPSKDPFYTAPPNFEFARPGEILRIRAAQDGLTSIYNASSAAYNILYRTTDSRYKASWAVTTLFVPKKPCTSGNGTKAPPLLSYQIPYDSADVDASPSILAYFQPLPAINRALNLGWYVSVPDYEGPLASFGLGVQAGHATIDNVRAVLTAGFGLTKDSRYALWGYSGGSIATEWAAELQVQYAPEMTFAGVAAGGTIPNVTNLFFLVSGTPYAGLLPSSFVGVTTQYPDAYQYLLDELKDSGPYNETTFLSVKNANSQEANVIFLDQDITNYFTSGAAFFSAPLIKHIINNDGISGYHGVPQMPVLFYKAIGDNFSAIADTDALVEKYCNVGANILYQRNTFGNHVTEFVIGDNRAFKWLTEVLTGSSHTPPQGCLVQNVTDNGTGS
jgi:hypothetical protein